MCVEGVPSVLEAAAIGVPGPGGGPEQLVLFLVPGQAPGERPAGPLDAVRLQCQAAIRSRLNPLFKVERVRRVLSSLGPHSQFTPTYFFDVKAQGFCTVHQVPCGHRRGAAVGALWGR